MSCTKTRALLEQAGSVEIAEIVIANKVAVEAPAALAMARAAKKLYVAKGKNLVELDVSAKVTDDELRALLIGPTGKLRAPAARIGKTLIVGFSPDAYRTVLGR